MSAATSPQFEPNAERYRRLSVDITEDEARAKLTAFSERLDALREEMGIPEVVAISGCYVGPGKMELSVCALGDQQRGVDLAIKLTQHLAAHLAATHRKRAEALDALAPKATP